MALYARRPQTWATCCIVDHPLDRPNPAGKFWTWRLWRHEVGGAGGWMLRMNGLGGNAIGLLIPHALPQVRIARLAAAKSVQVRAWDSSFNTQPAEIAWNVLGMMVSAGVRTTVARGVVVVLMLT